jgi:putative endonuclease
MDLARFIGSLSNLFRRRLSSSPDSEENPEIWLGKEGERLAKGYLRTQGYKILYENFRAPHGGEVDLVCRDRGSGDLVFVEVKTRRSTAYGAPGEAVTLSKQKLIARGALKWLRMLDNPKICYRFDIVEIVIEDEEPRFNLIRDAFRLPEPYIY